MEKEEIIRKIRSAYRQLISKDGHLFTSGVNELSLTHKLAEYLQAEFSDWNVDCEYNRNGLDSKKLDTFKQEIESDDTDATTVYPDIIIHQRGTKNNLVVIEAKKSNNSSNNLDEDKLRAYKNDLDYLFAFKVDFPIKKDFSESIDITGYIQEVL